MLAGHTNYLIGGDSSKWVKDIPQYARVNYQDVYPGVDLTFYGQQRQLEFDFIVKPGGDPSAISLGIEGAKKIAMHKTGDLVLSSAPGDLLLHKPVAYQKAGNTRQPIDAQFVLKGTEVALSVGPYDHQRELVIDPAIGYGTYLGSGGEDTGLAIAVDSSGATYITGQTASTGFPLKNPLSTPPDNALLGASDAFVTKLSADGTALVYSTFLGGTDVDSGNAIAVDNVTGQAYIAGATKSHDFPMAGSSAQNTPGGSGTYDAFVAVLSATGNSLVYSTYVGGAGNDIADGIAIDSTGIYITGSTSSTNFPPVNALQLTLSGTGTTDAFVTKLRALPAGSFAYSSYLGGTDNDGGTGIAVDPSSNIYVTGFTFSTTFPNATTNSNAGGEDAFVAEIKADFSQYVYFSFLGGSGKDIGDQIAVDGSGNAYIAGQTGSSNFPTNGTNAAFQTALATGSSQNAFLTVVKPGGTSYLYSTYLGGKGLDTALALALDSATPPKVYVTGQTSSSNFPTTTNATQPQIGGMTDAFVSILNPNVAGSGSLIFSTYLGGSADEDDLLAGIAVDATGNFYVTGDTQSSTNISTPGSFAPTFSGGTGCTGAGIICRDAFVVKYLPNAPQFKVSIGAVSPSSISRGSNGTATVTVTSTGASGTVTLGCAIQGTAATPPTCSVNPTSGTLAANGTVTTTLTITTIKSGAISVTGAALWLPIPGLALFGIGFLRKKKSNRRVLWSLLCTFALTGILLMMGCGNGNGGSTGSGGGGGGGTTTGSYTATVTAAIASTGSQSGSVQFNVQ
jgi:Beta-propeller repeat